MNTLEAINARRSVRRYLDRPVEFEKITTILDAARKAPSAGNLQDWRFVIVSERGLISQVASYSIEQYWVQTAPLVIIVCAVPEKHEMYYGLRGKRLYNIQDCAASIQNILLAATELGLGSCWIGAFEEEKLRELFGIPVDVRPQAVITIGYSDETPKDRQLIELENLAFFNRYNSKIEKLHIVFRDYSTEWQKQSENIGHATQRHFKRFGENIKNLGTKVRDRLRKKKPEDKK